MITRFQSALLVTCCTAGFGITQNANGSTYHIVSGAYDSAGSPTPVSFSYSEGHPAGDNVPQDGFDSSAGSATATFGQVGASSTVVSSYPGPNGGGFADGARAHSTASMDLDGLIIAGPAGQILVSFNFVVEGSIAAGASGDVVGSARVAATYILGDAIDGGGHDLGELFLGDTGIYRQSGIFANYASSSNISVFEALSTVPILYNIGDTTLNFGLFIDTSATTSPNPGIGTANASADFAHTAGFSTSGPVANLPLGYTLNSLDGTIVDNHFVGVPEPSTVILSLIGGSILGIIFRRGRAH